jgi:hypothetical protein
LEELGSRTHLGLWSARCVVVAGMLWRRWIRFHAHAIERGK